MATNVQKGGMKKMQHSTSDRISHLPRNVTEKILMSLPLRDAVRTSALSSKWRNAWVTLPQLVFDDAFYRKLRRRRKNNFMMTIYQVMLLHRGPIVKFELSVPVLESRPEIDQLILFLSNNGLQELVLHIKQGKQPYRLPSYTFSCLQLEHLELNFCLFSPPLGFRGFSILLTLELSDVAITSEVFSSLVSGCPLLERLKVSNHKTSFSWLEIAAPNLKSLCFAGQFGFICLKNAYKLARVSISFYEWMPRETYGGGEICNWVTFFASLPAVEFLELDYGCLKFFSAGGVLDRLPTDPSHLKILKLYIESVDAFSSILCLLRSSPNLEKFVIGVPIHADEDEETLVKLSEVERCSDMSLNKLREVELQEAWGRRFGLLFIKLLLAKSPVLEKMVVPADNLFGRDRMKFMQLVTQFKRCSPHAEVYSEVPDADRGY
ncbi:F-box/FBD/LRR-repeat protein At1g13570-like [Diospyros lotus]|uniref:F-box/FBD/LRR-repeat protein At1g13570-like n=1 Tax=Diospyros lotus TaxID=55363 RepID=UPI002254162D|nr:F-box/FBD/LRR-repeat protein At1g13570-like [Diospyros lotus]XP_052187778.1 F-box/FBD/LRR-repeat protein At1g13570-like [Diospyros lotus]XP_052187779.1 F-box/FBD/LRR-repeat protein At1g13570-like [Diospyros lotus]XP_052187780.1 F-box/FBD/LRR-repeat protein At1g13570-like [Diospyros lotus]XP_052187781.1 F-box/FBD/LRR-repeat protein At1g13570-like [Diospyros lotus]